MAVGRGLQSLIRKLPRFFVAVVVFLISISFANAEINFGDNSNFDPAGPGIKIIAVAPPGIFTLPGSETTNFTRVCTLGEALNIVLDVSGKNKVEFHDSIIDMCDTNTINNLDTYIQLDKTGEVTVDSESLTYLRNKRANITMRNLPFEEEPAIEVDGKLATPEDIKDKLWNQSAKELVFTAKHFTTYKAVERGEATRMEELETMPCDLNTDGQCDDADSALFQQALGKRRNDLGYNPLADVDADGVVTVADQEILFPGSYDYVTTFPRDVYTINPSTIIRYVLLIGGGIAGALIAYIVWRKRKKNFSNQK